MTTTAFFTHCCKNARASLARWLALACLLLGAALPAQADVATDITQMRLERTEEGVFLSANIRFDLPAVVEDALLKGLSMYFVAEADLYRDRWYWYDRKITGAARHMRVSYQPLTRRWRLQVAPGPINNTGLGVTLGQNFDTLEEAMAAVKRISRWKIAEAAEIEPDARRVRRRGTRAAYRERGPGDPVRHADLARSRVRHQPRDRHRIEPATALAIELVERLVLRPRAADARSEDHCGAGASEFLRRDSRMPDGLSGRDEIQQSMMAARRGNWAERRGRIATSPPWRSCRMDH